MAARILMVVLVLVVLAVVGVAVWLAMQPATTAPSSSSAAAATTPPTTATPASSGPLQLNNPASPISSSLTLRPEFRDAVLDAARSAAGAGSFGLLA